MSDQVSATALQPAQVAAAVEAGAAAKGNQSVLQTVLLALLGGMFLALGAAFSTAVLAGNGVGEAIALPFGLIQILAGVAFALGFVLVVAAGGQLFTGNDLLLVATMGGKLSPVTLVLNWFVVLLCNAVGAVAVAFLLHLAGNHLLADGQVGATTLALAEAKCSMGFVPALIRGILCNMLVCGAVILAHAGRNITDKIVALVLPITAIVVLGLEHLIANLYIIPSAVLIKMQATDAFWNDLYIRATDFGSVTWQNGLQANLLPVLLGNLIGGVVCVSLLYALAYRVFGSESS